MNFCAEVQGCGWALRVSFPKNTWIFAPHSHSGPKYLYLTMKSSDLRVYLVPTVLSIFRKMSHLHVYLVYTFIQYHEVHILKEGLKDHVTVLELGWKRTLTLQRWVFFRRKLNSLSIESCKINETMKGPHTPPQMTF